MKSLKQKFACVAIITFLLTICSCDNSKPEEPLVFSTPQTPVQQETELQRLERQRIEQEELERLRLEQERLAFRNSINIVLTLDANTSSISDLTTRVNAMRDIDLSQCPRDFAVAYIDHIHAWKHSAEAYNALTKLHEDGNIGAVLLAEGISQLLELDEHPLKDAADAENRLTEAATEASGEIKSTWETIERISVGYGATLPKS